MTTLEVITGLTIVQGQLVMVTVSDWIECQRRIQSKVNRIKIEMRSSKRAARIEFTEGCSHPFYRASICRTPTLADRPGVINQLTAVAV